MPATLPELRRRAQDLMPDDEEGQRMYMDYMRGKSDQTLGSLEIPETALPGWMTGAQRAAQRVTAPVTDMPIAGGPAWSDTTGLSPAEIIPESKWGAGLAVASALPMGKMTKSARKAAEKVADKVRAVATEHAEAVTGAATGHLPTTRGAPWTERQAFTEDVLGAFRTPEGRDILHEAGGLESQPGRAFTGSYANDLGELEVNPGRALPVDIPRLATGEIPPEAQEKMMGLAALRGVMTAQNMQAYSLLPRSARGTSMNLPMASPATQQQIRESAAAFPNLIFADTGIGMNILNFGDRLKRGAQKQLQKIFTSGKAVTADSAGDYIDFVDNWAKQPGSGEVTNQMWEYLGKLPTATLGRVDQAVRAPAARLLDVYGQRAAATGEPVREDLMNLLRTIRDEGLGGVQEGLKKKAFFPAVAGALLLPSIFDAQPEGEY